ncbi:egg cell-secreted protein 1.2-like protein [Tanacetum coccineum]
MASKNLIAFAIVCLLWAYTASARDIFFPVNVNVTTNTTVNGTTASTDCWIALYDVKSCSNEISSYFKNGTVDIGPSCFQAVKTITHDCWPNLLTMLGFTLEETNVLRGYCDASASPASRDIHAVQALHKPAFLYSSNGTMV